MMIIMCLVHQTGVKSLLVQLDQNRVSIKANTIEEVPHIHIVVNRLGKNGSNHCELHPKVKNDCGDGAKYTNRRSITFGVYMIVSRFPVMYWGALLKDLKKVGNHNM